MSGSHYFGIKLLCLTKNQLTIPLTLCKRLFRPSLFVINPDIIKMSICFGRHYNPLVFLYFQGVLKEKPSQHFLQGIANWCPKQMDILLLCLG